MIEIRASKHGDFEAIWPIFREVISTGDTYTFPPNMSKPDAASYWMSPNINTYVAVEDGTILGSYILKPNQPGLGSHVANTAFMVSQKARSKGVGKAMGEHALAEAKRLGYQAMQFNFVVSTNTGAVALWQKLGFKIVGILPKAFQHQNLGLVDAYVMHRFL